MAENEKVLVGIKRSLIVDDILKVDAVLLDLQKSGKQVIQISPIPRKGNIKEPVESWKTGEPESSGSVNVEFDSSVMVIYLDTILQEEWLERVRANVVKIDENYKIK